MVDLYGKCIGAPHIDLKAVCVFPENSVQLMDSAGEPLIASHFSKIEGADGEKVVKFLRVCRFEFPWAGKFTWLAPALNYGKQVNTMFSLFLDLPNDVFFGFV